MVIRGMKDYLHIECTAQLAFCAVTEGQTDTAAIKFDPNLQHPWQQQQLRPCQRWLEARISELQAKLNICDTPGHTRYRG